MFQKLNLLFLAALCLVARNMGSNWPSEFRPIGAWNLTAVTSSPSKVASMVAISENPPVAVIQKIVATGPTPTGIEKGGVSKLQMRLPSDFVQQKFLRFKVNLVFISRSESFQFSLRNLQGLEVSQVRLDQDGHVSISETERGRTNCREIGLAALKASSNELVIGLNLASSEILVTVNGEKCRPLYIQALDLKSPFAQVSDIDTVELQLFNREDEEGPDAGHLTYFGLDEAKL